ncbi:MAG TPA: HAD hydrolase-like protein [Solirubrobacteraceae bacterium]|nr:HAD hydrolase-like protein [Solirubrobacteraceae bacterium]
MSVTGFVLLDLDGVLVDSRAAITGCINEALVDHGLPAWSAESLQRFIGPPLAQAFAELTGEDAASGLVASCVAAYRRRYATVSLTHTEVVPGIPEALTKLAVGSRLAVASSKPLAFVEPLLQALGLRGFFSAVAGPDLSIRGEEKAVTIGRALNELGCPARAVMVGDRSFDVVGAHAHSLLVVGVSWGIGSRDELTTAGAELVIDTPDDLPAAVRRMLEHAASGGAGREPPQRPDSRVS